MPTEMQQFSFPVVDYTPLGEEFSFTLTILFTSTWSSSALSGILFGGVILRVLLS